MLIRLCLRHSGCSKHFTDSKAQPRSENPPAEIDIVGAGLVGFLDGLLRPRARTFGLSAGEESRCSSLTA
ncbi:hypothetical protein AB0I37_12495 [Micromonospora purpureochromogenes]|uniref:hypothetical protein n=1 Tax=Micromonospora purpureochromogenes TaxID=47872 RepID=UPI0033C4A4DC